MIYKLDWNKYSWRKFEKICYEYIRTIYSAEFYRTKLTKAQKDSGRDIIIKDYKGTFEAWGECKDHKRNVDLSVIGKNVVLALSHQINKAIFFSVTSITPNTKIEILRMSQKQGFEVLFLDGNDLNAEILNCEKVAKKYFRKEYEEYIKNNKSNIWIDTLVSEFPFAEDARNSAKKQYHLQNSFQIFLHLFIKNAGNVDISDINVKLLNIPNSDMIFYETEHRWEKNTEAYSDLLYTFCGMVISPKKNINMPQIAMNYTFSTGDSGQETITVGTVDASDIWKAPYVNSDAVDFFASTTNILEKVVPQNYVKVFYLYGKSGMGKSRLMSEIENKAYENSYRVIHVDFREKEEMAVMQSFVMALLSIPSSKSKLYLEYTQFQKLYYDKVKLDDMKELYNFIYSPNYTDIPDSLADTIINLLVTESAEEQLLLSIDNIQEISCDLQIVFWNVLAHCKTISISVCFVFSHNTDRQIIKKNALIQYLTSCVEHADSFVLPWCCDILQENDAVILIQTLLHLSSESDDFIKRLLSKIELCPMDILLLAKSLEQIPGLFKTMGNRRYLANTNSFSLEQLEITEAFNTVVKLRLSNLLDNTSKPERYKQFLSLLTFFEGQLKMEIFERCNFSMDMLSHAQKNIIVKVNPVDNTIHFYHEKIYQYAKKEYTGLSTNILDAISNFYDQIENKSFSDFYFHFKILIAKGQKECAIKQGFKLLHQYQDSIQCSYIIKICDLLLQIIDPEEEVKDFFSVMFLKADFLLERANISEAENLFEKTKKLIMNKDFLFTPSDVTHFFHKYINQKLHTLQYEKALGAIEELSRKGKIATNSPMIINDRLCVALYSLGRETEALEAIEKVIKMADEEKNSIWLSIAYSDKAFCYYYNSKNINEICSSFSNAIHYYENGEEYNDLSRKIEIQIQKAIVNIIRKDYERAESEIQQSIQVAESVRYGYLLVPSYNIHSYLMIINHQIKMANELLKRALDYANIFSNPKALVSIYNNLGSMYTVTKEYEKAYTHYMEALQILKEICKPQNSFRYMSLLSNIVKLSIFLNKAETLSEAIHVYDFEALKVYKEKSQKTLCEKGSLESFSYGILSFNGYDYLY